MKPWTKEYQKDLVLFINDGEFPNLEFRFAFAKSANIRKAFAMFIWRNFCILLINGQFNFFSLKGKQ